MRDDWRDVPLDFDWTREVVAEVARLHAAGEDEGLHDPSMHFAAFGLDLLERAGDAVLDERSEDALVADLLRSWLAEPPASPELVAEVRRDWRAAGDRVPTRDATRGYALFGLRLLALARDDA